METTIESPPGSVVGSAKELYSLGGPHFIIFDSSQRPLFALFGPCNMCACDNVNFDIFRYGDERGQPVATITKHWIGSRGEQYAKKYEINCEFIKTIEFIDFNTLFSFIIKS